MERVAIIGGARTAFVKAGGAFAGKSFLDLAKHAVISALKSAELKPESLDELIFSTVLLDPRMPNAARQLVLESELPDSLSAHFISNNCISGLVALNMIAEGIQSGRIRTGLGGGSESMSCPTLTLSRAAERFFISLFSARDMSGRLKALSSFRPGMLLPQPPSPREPSTGLTMGQHCELMAKEFQIAREWQDKIAFKSHQNAARAQQQGYLAQEIVTFDAVAQDNIIRADTSLERLAKLKPVFDRSEKGTLTAGNSSPLTDGASAVCFMAESEARKQGREILGFWSAVEYAAIAPNDGLLMAPGLALPRLLERRNLKVSDIDIFEIHEAFGAQVAANMLVWRDGWQKYPQLKAIGEIPEEKINVNGGSIAIGHPFAATGGRLVLSAVHELKRRSAKRALLSVCAAGAMGAVVLIERE